jgi:hypothetical protein
MEKFNVFPELLKCTLRRALDVCAPSNCPETPRQERFEIENKVPLFCHFIISNFNGSMKK